VREGGREEGREEEEEDVVLLPFVDSYYNLSVKTAVMLRWPETDVREGGREGGRERGENSTRDGLE